jgi:hypothetical protein
MVPCASAIPGMSFWRRMTSPAKASLNAPSASVKIKSERFRVQSSHVVDYIGHTGTTGNKCQ